MFEMLQKLSLMLFDEHPTLLRVLLPHGSPSLLQIIGPHRCIIMLRVRCFQRGWCRYCFVLLGKLPFRVTLDSEIMVYGTCSLNAIILGLEISLMEQTFNSAIPFFRQLSHDVLHPGI